MTQNKSPIFNFRMEALHIVLPTQLGGPLQNEAVTDGVNLNAPLCGYTPTNHIGGFNWLISLNTSIHRITTGGALPVQDPYDAGYSFLTGRYGDSGTLVAPVCLDAGIAELKTTGEIHFSSEPGGDVLNVPIFTSNGKEQGDPIILPIRRARFYDVTVSADANCIGDINQEWYAHGGTCSDNELDTCPKWYTAGAIGGFITLVDAQDIELPLGASLCSVLVHGLSGTPCSSSDIAHGGDYCSATEKAGGCQDSRWLAATFAANAVKISDAGPPACK
jgi:hypothetical protein